MIRWEKKKGKTGKPTIHQNRWRTHKQKLSDSHTEKQPLTGDLCDEQEGKPGDHTSRSSIDLKEGGDEKVDKRKRARVAARHLTAICRKGGGGGGGGGGGHGGGGGGGGGNSQRHRRQQRQILPGRVPGEAGRVH